MMMQNYVSMGVAMIVWLPSQSSVVGNPRGQGTEVVFFFLLWPRRVFLDPM